MLSTATCRTATLGTVKSRLSARASVRQGLATRLYSDSASAGSSSWALWLAGAGCVGLAGYSYWEYSDKFKAVTVKPQQLKSPLDPQKFVDFKLKEVRPYNKNTSEFVFDLPDDQASLLPVASCVLVKASSEDIGPKDRKGNTMIRPYTPISPSEQPGELTFLIKKYDSGNVSKHVHEMKLGDSLSIKGPIKKWDYKVNEFDDVVLIGGGSGITPLYQILEYALSQKENRTSFKLVYANIAEDDILLKKEIDALAAKYSNNLNVVYTLDKPSSTWKGRKGYVSQDLIKEVAPPPTNGEKVKIFVCGPPGQVAAIAGAKDGMKQGALGGTLEKLGYTADQVFKF